MKMNIAYKIDMYSTDGKLHDLGLIVPIHAVDDIIDKVVIPGLDPGEEFKVTKVAYTEVVDE